MSKQFTTIHWFRRDLRLEDNRPLSRALSSAGENGLVLPLFIFDREILKRLEDDDDSRVGFIHTTLAEMKRALRARGSDLLVLVGRPDEIWQKIFTGDRQVLGELSDRIKVKSVTIAADYEPYARERDRKVKNLAAAHGVEFLEFKDQVVFEKAEVVKDDGKPYTVFTPYSKKWRGVLANGNQSGEKNLQPEKCGSLLHRLIGFESKLPSLKDLGFRANEQIKFPRSIVETDVLKRYETMRDLPAVRGTSRLGLHLRFGTISVRRAVAKAIELKAEAWLNELIWREFFMQILWHFPQVVDQAFRTEYDQIVWRTDESNFSAWQEGRTGYPLVDAGMRELNATGFMHNRVRMVAASFLVKHLLLDWRWGEAYFARKLLDFDLAANNGNWQWVAGSGTDAAPYFRIFNPELQAKRFDPKSEYIRKWVPEFGTPGQLAPIVDHAEARARVLRAYAVVKEKM